MTSNLERYRKDLDSLVERGRRLVISMYSECFPEQFKRISNKKSGTTTDEANVRVSSAYQPWYSEARAVVKQLLPDRLLDFVSHYEAPKRKELTNETYRIVDYLRGLQVTRGYEKVEVAGPKAAIAHIEQQVAILDSARARFDSSLFDIRQLVQADLFDSELDASEELARCKFGRAAGALAGVVLERHLAQVCENHSIKLAKKAPVISDLNNVLKEADVIDVPLWRFIQHLADIRNVCDHDRKGEPSIEQVNELVAGVKKITKTLF